MAGALFHPRLEPLDAKRDVPLVERALHEVWQSGVLDYAFPSQTSRTERSLAAALTVQKYGGGLLVAYDVLQKNGSSQRIYTNDITGFEPIDFSEAGADDCDWHCVGETEAADPLQSLEAKMCYTAVSGMVSGRVLELRYLQAREARRQTAAESPAA